MNSIRKIAMASLLFTVVISINATATISTPRKKSRDIALIKAIGGTILTLGGAFYGFVIGPATISLGIRNQDKEYIVFGSILSSITLLVGYAGYKMAKNGFTDLDELAQQEKTLKITA